jgi:hypothetical protein
VVTDGERWTASLLRRGGRSPEALARAGAELLTRPVGELLGLGSDERVIPRAGRNSYGLPLVDLHPVVRGSSCTATPPDATAVGVAEMWRRRLHAHVLTTGALPSHESLRADITGPMMGWLGLPDSSRERVVLTASGTDAEAIVTGLMLAGSDRPFRNVLIGALEAGSGTKLAASGCYFNGQTPFRTGVSAGNPITGFPQPCPIVVDVELRDRRGRPRRPFDVEAEVEAHVEDALDCNERVLVHVMAGSKTGLRQLDPAWVRTWKHRHPRALRVVVDAAQARLPVDEVRAYVDAGATVAITGSKALCGPPFCGALVLDDSLLADAMDMTERGMVLPDGLRDVIAAADLPAALLPLLPAAEPVNLGLLARWAVALDEAERLNSFSRADREVFGAGLIRHLAIGLDALPRVSVLHGLGATSTIVCFSLLDAADHPLDKSALGDVYLALVSLPGVQVGQPVELSPGGAAALRIAIGSTTVTRALATGVSPAAAASEVARTTLDVMGRLLPEHAAI